MVFAIVFLLGSVALFVAPPDSGFVEIFVATLTVYVLFKLLSVYKNLVRQFRLTKAHRIVAITGVVLITCSVYLTSNYLSYQFIEHKSNHLDDFATIPRTGTY